MTRRKKRNSRRSRRNIGSPRQNVAWGRESGGEVVSFPFRNTLLTDFSTMAGGFSVSVLVLDPTSINGRILQESTQWELFRFTKFKVTTMFDVNNVNVDNSGIGLLNHIAYSRLANSDTVAPGNEQLMAQFDDYKVVQGPQKASWQLTRRHLALQQFKWFRVSSRNSPPYDNQHQGCVYLATSLRNSGGLTVNFGTYTVVEGVCEFTGRIDTSDQVQAPKMVVEPWQPRNSVLQEEKSDCVLVR